MLQTATLDGGQANGVALIAGYVLWAVWIVSWLAAAFWARAVEVAAPRSTYRVQLAIVGIGFAGLFALSPPGSGRLWSLPAWPSGGLVALIAVGFAFAWWARITLGSLWSGGVVTREGHHIVDGGPYRLVRHPIYTGLILSAVAFALIRATIPALGGAVLIAFGFALKARVEERFLAVELGVGNYDAYRARVPMLVPFGRPRR